ncbi:hypothetical protein ACPDG9_13930 [Myroides sp. C6-3]
MIDSLNALQSYLDTLQSKGFHFSFTNHSNSYFTLICFPSQFNTIHNRQSFVLEKPCTEYGVSKLLEEIEIYVESRIEK